MKYTDEAQNKIIDFVTNILKSYKDLNKDRNQTLFDIYKVFSTYKEQRNSSSHHTNFLINKAHEVVERVLPRIIAKSPKWLVTPSKVFAYNKEVLLNPNLSEEEKQQQTQDEIKKGAEYSQAVQDYLTYLFDEYADFTNKIRLFAKNIIVYGKARAKISWVADSYFSSDVKAVNDKTEKTVYEVVTGIRPKIDVQSWRHILTDPRYIDSSDLPAYLELEENVRLSHLVQKKQYFNIDKLKEVANLGRKDMDLQEYNQNLSHLLGGQYNLTSKLDKGVFNVWHYYGYYSLSDDVTAEQLYHFSFIPELRLLIYAEKIVKLPFVECNCFDDVETNFSTGFIEPIMGLQQELNFKKNTASEYINLALNRSWVWSPMSGINPKDLISKPNGIIMTSKDAQTALANCVEIPMRVLPPQFFQEQNDIERQIQTQTFTIDTTTPQGQQALTNTATGARIEFYESSVVINQIRKQFEHALTQIAYLLLETTFEQATENIVYKKQGTEEYWEMNKELLRDSLKKYVIKVEANSTSFDSLETRRQDALAFFNIMAQAQQAGAEVNLEKVVIDIVNTFEKRNPYEYLKPKDLQKIADSLPQAGPTGKPQDLQKMADSLPQAGPTGKPQEEMGMNPINQNSPIDINKQAKPTPQDSEAMEEMRQVTGRSI